uniref:Uncharacterized protein n=1 Tax=Corvus moneduloides TaxID=1196302 RepID=A0A8U7N6S7_CORMO
KLGWLLKEPLEFICKADKIFFRNHLLFLGRCLLRLRCFRLGRLGLGCFGFHRFGLSRALRCCRRFFGLGSLCRLLGALGCFLGCGGRRLLRFFRALLHRRRFLGLLGGAGGLLSRRLLGLGCSYFLLRSFFLHFSGFLAEAEGAGGAGALGLHQDALADKALDTQLDTAITFLHIVAAGSQRLLERGEGEPLALLGGGHGLARKPAGPSVTELITKAVSASKERKGLSLAALKKALAAGGYDVEKNNSRIKLGLKSLVSKGTLVQTKGTGASGSFRLNKKPGEVKEKAPKKRAPAAKPKKPAAKKPASAAKKPKKAAAVKKSPKKAKKPAAAAAKKAVKSPKKAAKAGRPKKAAKSPAKAKAVKPKAAKPKAAKPKAAKAKKAAPKKK